MAEYKPTPDNGFLTMTEDETRAELTEQLKRAKTIAGRLAGVLLATANSAPSAAAALEGLMREVVRDELDQQTKRMMAEVRRRGDTLVR